MLLAVLSVIAVVALFIVILAGVISRQRICLDVAQLNLESIVLTCRKIVITQGRLPQSAQEIQAEMSGMGMELRQPGNRQPLRLLYYYGGYQPASERARSQPWQVLVYHDHQRHLLAITAMDGHGDKIRTELVDEHFRSNILDLVVNK